MQQSTRSPTCAWPGPGSSHSRLLLVLLVALLGGDAFIPGGSRLDGSPRLGVAAHALGRADGTAAKDPHVANLGDCPSLRIAVVNGVPYHYEVLAGLLHVLRPYADRTDVFLNPYTRSSSSDGAWEILRWSKARFVMLTRSALASLAKKKPEYDLVILVSPDYELDANAALLRYVQRRLTVAFVHNSDFNQTQRLIEVAAGTADELRLNSSRASSALVDQGSSVVRVGSRGALEHTAAGNLVASDVRLVTLSPHTAASLAEATGRPTEWILAVYPFQPRTDCLQATEVDLLGRCLKGFGMQVLCACLCVLKSTRKAKREDNMGMYIYIYMCVCVVCGVCVCMCVRVWYGWYADGVWGGRCVRVHDARSSAVGARHSAFCVRSGRYNASSDGGYEMTPPKEKPRFKNMPPANPPS